MRPDRDLVAALAKSVLPSDISVAATDPTERPEAVLQAEARAVAVALPARRIEFFAGRAAARAAMVDLGARPGPVPMGPDRAPVWPEGLTGSISHTSGACVAAVGLSAKWAGIGLDLDVPGPLDAALVPEVCTVAERAWLDLQPPAERGLMARVIFSVKEATYKAQYPLSGQRFGFGTLEVRVFRDTSRFEAVFQTPQGPFAPGRILAGAYAHAADVLVSGVAIGQFEREVFDDARGEPAP